MYVRVKVLVMTFRETSVAPRFAWSHWILAFVVVLFSGVVQAQCPNVLDGDGMVSANPNYLRCMGCLLYTSDAADD